MFIHTASFRATKENIARIYLEIIVDKKRNEDEGKFKQNKQQVRKQMGASPKLQPLCRQTKRDRQGIFF